MELPMDIPGYIVFRNVPPGEPYDLTAPPQFFPPKDSDELFDALRAKFPLVKTHSERMRDAIIEFLLNERDSELQASTQSPAVPTTGTTASLWQEPWQSMSSGSEFSQFSSPDLFDFATPSFGDSPPADMVFPMATRSNTNSSDTSTPVLEDMTGVFSLSSAQQPKQRVRRKMTEAEKVEYRKRRIVKACEKCSKRKRKCQHNQPEMETLTPQRAGKVTKPRTTQTKPSQSPGVTNTSTGGIPADAMDLGQNQMFDMSHMQQGSMPDFDFDFDLLVDFEEPSFAQQPHQSFAPSDDFTIHPWQWSSDGDFTLLSSPKAAARGMGHNDLKTIAEHEATLAAASNYSIHTTRRSTASVLQGNKQPQHIRAVQNIFTCGNDVGSGFVGTSQASSMPPLRGYDCYPLGWQGESGGNDGNIPQTNNLAEQGGMITGRQNPTHNYHVHCAEGEGAYLHHNSREITGIGSQLARPQSLPRAVLQIVGTTRAVRSFVRLRPAASATTIPMTRVATAVGAAALHAERCENGFHSDPTSTRWARNERLPAHYHTAGDLESDRSIARPDGRSNSAQLVTVSALAHRCASENRASTSTRSSNVPHNLTFHRMNERTSTSMSASGEAIPAPPATEGRPPLSSERSGIERSQSPSTELFRLRRRIQSRTGQDAIRSVCEDLATSRPTRSPTTTLTLRASKNGGAHQHPEPNNPPNKSQSRHAEPMPASSLDFTSDHDAAGASRKPVVENYNPPPVFAPETGCRIYRARRHTDPEPTAMGGGDYTWQENRLSDHVRYRDHHGRDSHLQLLSSGCTAPGESDKDRSLAWRTCWWKALLALLLLFSTSFDGNEAVAALVLVLVLAAFVAVNEGFKGAKGRGRESWLWNCTKRGRLFLDSWVSGTRMATVRGCRSGIAGV